MKTSILYIANLISYILHLTSYVLYLMSYSYVLRLKSHALFQRPKVMAIEAVLAFALLDDVMDSVAHDRLGQVGQ